MAPATAMSARSSGVLGKKYEDLRIITCHLGNGSSICAVDHGKCVDTSMGLTPLGHYHGYAQHALDPAILQFIMNSDNISVDEMLEILNKSSAFLASADQQRYARH